jgi:hypothetical protein
VKVKRLILQHCARTPGQGLNIELVRGQVQRVLVQIQLPAWSLHTHTNAVLRQVVEEQHSHTLLDEAQHILQPGLRHDTEKY